MPLRLRLALWYGTLFALILILVTLLGYEVYVGGQYQTLDQVLLLSAQHVQAGLRAAGISYVFEADSSPLEVAFRQYGADGSVVRTSRQPPPAIELDPIQALGQPSRYPVPLPWLRSSPQLPEFTVLGIRQYQGQRWRFLVTRLEGRDQSLGYLAAFTPLSNLDAAVARLGRAVLLLGVLSVLGVFGLSLVLARLVLRPVTQLTQAANEIAHSQDLTRRVEGGSNQDELGLLGTTFNSMLDSLERGTQNQKRFVADASHELRAPLTAIQGNLDLLYLYPQMPESERKETIQKANHEVNRLSRLVSDLLTLAKSDTDLPIRRVRLEFAAIIQEALHEAQHLLEGQHLQRVHLEPTHLKGDPDHLKQLVLILLDNAIKYTPSGGTIRVELRHQAQQALLKISDSGIGIAKTDLPKVFDRFYRADPARNRNKGGTGLGLSIARWVVERHGGKISLESQPGKGTLAVVWLPLENSA